MSKQSSFLMNPKIMKTRYQNDHQFLSFKKKLSKLHQSTLKKRRPFVNQNYFEKSTSKWGDFSPIKITLKKVHWNNVDFSLIDIALNKVRWNDMDFSTWKRRENSSIFSFGCIYVISASNRRWFGLLWLLIKWSILRRLSFLIIFINFYSFKV